MTTKRITDSDCLRAATRALNAHLALRPATGAELTAMAADLRIKAAAIRAASRALPQPPTISSCIEAGERGAQVEALNHDLGRAENQRVKDCLRMEAEASRIEARAESLESAAALGDGVQYAMTLTELRERVAYYSGLVE